MARKIGERDWSTLRFMPEQVQEARRYEELEHGPLWGELNVLLYGTAEAPTPEEWRRVKFEGKETYFVSDLGRLAVWRELPARIWERNGYNQAVVYWCGDKAPRSVHGLVVKTFGKWKEGHEVVRHLNSDPFDNNLNNLEPGSQAENLRDVRRRQRGEVPVIVPPAKEVWRLNRDYAGVRVSNLGRVKLGWWVAFKCTGIVYKTGMAAGKKKHVSVLLGQKPHARYRLLHRLVYEAFRGEVPTGTLVRHLNDDPHDNRLENLAVGTHKENAVDRARNGGDRYGEDHPSTKYTDVQRGKLLDLVGEGMAVAKAARLVGMNEPSAYQVVARWRKGLIVRRA